MSSPRPSRWSDLAVMFGTMVLLLGPIAFGIAAFVEAIIAGKLYLAAAFATAVLAWAIGICYSISRA